MATPQQVVDQARGYLGVPWRHQGRTARGLDCAGLVIRVAHDLGLTQFDVVDYGRRPQGDQLQTIVDANCAEVFGAPEPGMVALMRFESEPQHLAIVAGYPHGGLALVHALATARRVVEHRLDDLWRRRIVALYELPGVLRDAVQGTEQGTEQGT